MYQVGDIFFYNSTGVCQVVKVGEPDLKGLPGGVDYYTLQPISSDHREMIYVPVNTTAYMRDVITPREAKDYLELVKELEPLNPESRNPKVVSDFYGQLISTYDCKNLLQVMVSLIVKKKECISKNKRLNQTQTNYLRRVSEMICNEFALVLGLSCDEIRQLIENNITVS
ncbi:MAG: CarD family transcriptional regulator [Oscillospiraceae bacterium]|nr:CarD family transcriptional regulator [Oscillospiraceae bacterium]